MTIRIASGTYTNSKKQDQAAYRERNREAINERKKAWREKQQPCLNCGRKLIDCCGNCIFDDLPNKGF